MRQYLDFFSIAAFLITAVLVGIHYGAKQASFIVFLGLAHEVDVQRRIKEYLKKNKATD